MTVTGSVRRERRRRRGLLSTNRDFRLFWLSETVSLIGSHVTTLALPLAAIEAFGATEEQVGLLRFVQLLPFLCCALLVGVWVDRVRRRPVLIGANLARMVVLAAVPVLYALGALDLSLLMVAGLLVGLATVVFDVTWMAYVPTLVPDRRDYVEATSRLGMSASTADVVGPGLAGVLVGVLTAPVALVVDAASYALSVVGLGRIRTPEPRPAVAADRSWRREARQAVVHVAGHPVLRALAGIGAACNFAMVSTWTMFLVVAVTDLDLAPGVVGLVFSCASVGGLVGAAVGGAVSRSRHLGRTYGVGQTLLLLGPWLLLVGIAVGGPGGVVLLALSFAVTYFGLGIAGVVIVSLRLALTPHHLTARMTAVFRTLLFGGGALGGLAGGFLVGGLGGSAAIGVVAAFSTVVVLVVWASPVRAVAAFPDGPAGPA